MLLCSPSALSNADLLTTKRRKEAPPFYSDLWKTSNFSEGNGLWLGFSMMGFAKINLPFGAASKKI